MKDSVLKFQIDLYSFINRNKLTKLIWDNQVSVVPAVSQLVAKFMT